MNNRDNSSSRKPQRMLLWLVFSIVGLGAAGAQAPMGDVAPAWSPVADDIAFQSDRGGNWDIYVMNADGSNQRPITNHPTSDRWPDWSPDGKKITFTSRRVGVNTKIFVSPRRRA